MLGQRGDESLFEYWVSFWPVAPFFGVRWRFEGMAPAMTGFDFGAATANGAASKPPAKAAPASAVEPAPKSAPNPAPVEPPASKAETPESPAEAPDAPKAGSAGPVESAPAEKDDLTQIKGVGPKLAALLNDLGIYRFDQIAGFTEADLASIDAQLGTFKGRPLRDGWIEQAKALA
jgi:predicted flap endonuclease-1-like 5' DNA nuclease